MFLVFKIQCMLIMGPAMILGLFVGWLVHDWFLTSEWLFRYPDRGLGECAGFISAVVPMRFAGRLVSRTSFATERGVKMQYAAALPLILGGVFFFLPFPDYQAKTLGRMEMVLEEQVGKARQWQVNLAAARKQLNTSDPAAVASYQRALDAYNAELELIKTRQDKVQEIRTKLGK